MLIDPALIALSNETACTITPGTAADLHTLPTTQTMAVRQPDLVLEPSSGPTRSTAARACEWTCDPDAFGLTTCFFFFQTLTQLLAQQLYPPSFRNRENGLQRMASE